MRKIIPVLFLVVTATMFASVRSIPEQSLARALEHDLWKYGQFISKEPVTSWAQITQVDPGLYGVNTVLKSGSVTEFFSFVPLEQRKLFPLGDLILVQSKAMPWPDRWKAEDPNNPGKYIDHPGDQEIRFFIYEKDGKYIADRWYETKFHAMLAETGLTIPPPTPYFPPPPTPPGEKPAAPSTPAAPIAAAQSAPAVAPGAKLTPATAPVAPSPAKSSNPLWWIVGAIAALAAVLFLVTRKKKPRA